MSDNTQKKSDGNILNKNIDDIGIGGGIFGSLFLFIGFIVLVSGSIFSGFLLLTLGTILLVPTKSIEERIGTELPHGAKVVLTIILITLSILFSGSSDSQQAQQSTGVAEDQTIVKTEANATTTKTEAKTTSVKKQVSAPVPTPTPAIVPQTDRASMLVILKADASAKWGDNYQMVKYEYDNQVEAYDWVVAQTKYPAIMTGAKQKWGNNYQMVKYEYENQVEAYDWIMAQTAYPEIMAAAKQKWGTNYQMVKYEYDNQVEAYKSL